jgi:phosphoribosyl 1,2-cyclic phosphodiesterase
MTAAAAAADTLQRLRLTFVGTGVSTAIPVIGHLDKACACADALANPSGPNARNNVSMLVQEWCPDGELVVPRVDTEAAAIAAAGDGAETTSAPLPLPYRTPPCFGKNVLIDCGKTFRSAYFRTLAPRRIADIAALVITHEHADAIGGIDELRDIQLFDMVPPSWHWRISVALPTFLSPFCLATLQRSVKYITDNSRLHPGFASMSVPGFESEAEKAARSSGAWDAAAALPRLLPTPPPNAKQPAAAAAAPSPAAAAAVAAAAALPHGANVAHPVLPWEPFVVTRRVTALDLHLLDESHGPFEFRVTPGGHAGRWFGVPVEHGAGYTCLGFVFGARPETRVVYLSDVSAVSAEVLRFLKSPVVQPIAALVVDALLPLGASVHFSHYNLQQALDLTYELNPRVAYGVGMWCEIEHVATNAALVKVIAERRAADANCRIERFELAFDGLEVTLE